MKIVICDINKTDRAIVNFIESVMGVLVLVRKFCENITANSVKIIGIRNANNPCKIFIPLG